MRSLEGSVRPCPLCGYDAEAEPCPHCGGEPLEPSLCGAPPRGAGAVLAGLGALPRGFGFLARGRGLKRWLAPPLVLTTALFVGTFAWTWDLVADRIDRLSGADVEIEGLSEGWLRSSLEWIVNEGPGAVVARAGSLLLFVLLSSLIAWYCFAIAFEAIAGPFLDEVQGRLEERWFGADPRATLERPEGTTSESVLRWSLAAGAIGTALGALAWWLAEGWWLLAAPLAVVAPFLVASRLRPDYGDWLRWMLRVESRALFVGVKVAVITGLLTLALLPLYLIPFAGPWVFAVGMGFVTALGLLDIAMERRAWRTGQQLRFAARHPLALCAFGIVTGLAFSVPLLGPIVAVPSASVGGLWLLCRLEKSGLA